MKREATPIQQDDLIIGAGPAGLQLGYYLRRSGRSYRILEAADGPGAFFRTNPRNRTLISINKRFTGFDDREVNLRWDWNSLLEEEGDEGPRFTEYSEEYYPSADRLVEYLEDFASRHELAITYDARVVRIDRELSQRRSSEGSQSAPRPGRFRVETEDGSVYLARRVFVATGMSKPVVPDIPGIELADSYSETPRDPEIYAGKHVLILGKGNSGFEMAEELVGWAAVIHVASPESVRFAWQTHHVGHLRALHNNFLDTYQLKCQNAVLDAKVESLHRREEDGRLVATVSYSHADGEREELVYDRVIHCAGFQFDQSIFSASCRPRLTLGGRFPDQTAGWESVNVPDLYFIGTLMQVRDYKKTTSSFIHGFRYNVRTLHRLIEMRDHSRPLPNRPVPATAEGLADAVLARANRSSALWQQFGYLGDVIVVPASGGEARWYEELPVDWVREGGLDLSPADQCYVVTLEFGPKQVDPFHIERSPDPERAGDSAFLHPVVRQLEGEEDKAAIHLLEHLYGEWHDEELHRKPLLEFFAGQLPARLAHAS